MVLRGDTTELTAQLDAVLVDMFHALEDDKWHEVATADVTFHQTIVQAAGSPRLERMFSTLAAETLLCVRQFQYLFERKETILEQHRRLRDLIVAREEGAYLAEIAWHLSTEMRRWRPRVNGATPHPTAKKAKAPHAAAVESGGSG